MSMRSRFFFRPLLVAALGLGAVLAQAQELRVGFVNTDRILREATTSKAAQAKLESEFSKRQKDIEALRAQLKAAADKFEKEAPTLPESQRIARQRSLVEQNEDIERKQREFREDLARRKNEELQGVLERANRVIKQVAESGKYDLILQEAVYINPKYDITDKVIGGLDAQK